jgi:hypothetical protein
MTSSWQRSCPKVGHNMVIRGERELRGERRGKGGRSLRATAVPFFFMGLMFPSAAAAQRVDVYARAGVVGSTALVTDHVADALPDSLNLSVDDEVRAVPAPGVAVAGGARVAFWPAVSLGLDVEWTTTELEADDGVSSRAVQDLSVLQTVVSASWRVRPALELGGGAGLIWYRTEERGLFRGGSDTSPLLEMRAGWTPAFWDGRVALIGAAQTHRFGTPVMRDEGGQDGGVVRLSVSARIRLLEVGR